MASLVKDYERYRQMRNVTFIGICTSATATVQSMEKQIERYDLKPFANMLDAGGATAAAYGLPRNATFRLVIIDGDGKIAYNASRGWHWTSGPNAGKFIHEVQLANSLNKYPGVLQAAAIPAGMEEIAHYYDLQQFGLLEKELPAAVKSAATEEAEEFGKFIEEKIAAHRRDRVRQIADYAMTDAVQAYREAVAFTKAFPKAPEMSVVQTLGQRLMAKPEVKKELDAENAYRQIMVPQLQKCGNRQQYDTRIKPMLDGYMQRYGATRFAKVVQNACEAHSAALGR